MKPAGTTLSASRQAILLTGITAPAVPAIIESLISQDSASVTFVFARNMEMAGQLAEDIAFYVVAQNRQEIFEIQSLPEIPETADEQPGIFDLQCDRLTALTRLNDFRDNVPGSQRLVIITTPCGFFHNTPPRQALTAREIRLEQGQSMPFSGLVEKLARQLGYDNEAVCEFPGQYAVRGGIIDVYPINGAVPYRLDFFADEIEEIRAYDPTTQRSLKKVERLTIAASPETGPQMRKEHIFDYLAQQVSWIIWEPEAMAQDFPELFPSLPGTQKQLPNFIDLFERRKSSRDQWFGIADLDIEDPLLGDVCHRRHCVSESLDPYRTKAADTFGQDRLQSLQAARSRFLEQVLTWQREGHAVYFVTNNSGEEQRLRDILGEDAALDELRPRFLQGHLQDGFRYVFGDGRFRINWPDCRGKTGVVVVTHNEIFERRMNRVSGARRRLLPTRAQVDQSLDFSELIEGDCLVHLQNGVCLYRGLGFIDLLGKKKEVISLEFDDGVILHLPLSESHLLTRYVGLAKLRPRLGRLGAKSWKRTRHAVEKATLDFAAQLLNLQAQRQSLEGHSFEPDSEWQREFEGAFIHRETPDQETAIDQVKADMERPNPMDRLICGDVGYGKTEVALRAVFKAVMDGKQAAVLVPTTVLAQQHLNTFRDRMGDYPLVVEMISRFRNRQRQKAILEQLAQGKIDIIIGTHRLLSRDVVFKDLGLLIVDEEHRFGVRHKERIKQMRENVDVLTMSATPIPRTLYLSLVAARDLSVIETPPQDRLPIHTQVKSYNLDLVKKAIKFEIQRGGQVFYLHNRVDTIDSVAQKLREIMPDLRIAVGHGQMSENRLERIMTRFVAGEFDVLVCTTIIESGLDIPNCNTIIIEGADRFGLSQLYQLRGRVGRFNRQAYAYLLLHRHSRILYQARKRLSAMRQYNQLGAGFKIAMRDLEMRGAGNLIGSEQSGHIAGVGFELYCQLLRQSIARLKGTESAQNIRATVRLDFVVEGEGENIRDESPSTGFAAIKAAELEDSRIPFIEAVIPGSYIGEMRLRLDCYRRMAMADNPAKVREIADDMKDRFGTYPDCVKALLLITEIRCLAENKRIQAVETEADRLKCTRAGRKRDDFIKIGHRFPRLTTKKPLLRLREIRKFLLRYES